MASFLSQQHVMAAVPLVGCSITDRRLNQTDR